MSAKLDTLGLLKINAFWNKGYDIIISFHDVTNKILSLDSNYIVGVVMWPKFGNSRNYHNLNLKRFVQKNNYFEEWSCFNFYYLKLQLVMALKL